MLLPACSGPLLHLLQPIRGSWRWTSDQSAPLEVEIVLITFLCQYKTHSKYHIHHIQIYAVTSPCSAWLWLLCLLKNAPYVSYSLILCSLCLCSFMCPLECSLLVIVCPLKKLLLSWNHKVHTQIPDLHS